MASDALHEPIPGLLFFRPCRLLDRDRKIPDLRFYLFAREHAETAYKDGKLQDRCLGSVETGEGGVCLLGRNAAEETWSHCVLLHLHDFEHGMGERDG